MTSCPRSPGTENWPRASEPEKISGMDLGPLEVLYCWQSALLAVGVATTTQGVKNALDVFVGGKQVRKKKLIITKLILPATPVLLGALGAVFIPLHPEALTAYMAARELTGLKASIALAAYGGAVGQFSDYLYARLSGLAALKAAPAGSEPSAPSKPGGEETPPAP